LAKALDRFIEDYVLCASEECLLPETNLELTETKLRKTCRACGTSAIIPSDHKLTNFIAKNVRPGIIVKESIEDDKIESVNIQDFTWSVDTSKEAVEKRKQEAYGQKQKEGNESGGDDAQKHLQELKELVSTKPDIKVFNEKVQKLQRQFGWNDQQVIQSLFMTLFDNNIIYQIKPLAEYIEPFVCDEKDQRIVLNCLEKLCHIDKAVIENIVHILYGLYDEDIVEEDTFYKWHKAMNKKLDMRISKQVRIKAKPFIQWLQDAEVEEDDF